MLSSAFCISSQGCFPYLIRVFPAAVACGRISFPKIQFPESNTTPTSKSCISWQACTEYSMYLIWISLCRTHSASWAVCGNTPATCAKPRSKHQWQWARSWRNCCSSAVRWHYVPGRPANSESIIWYLERPEADFDSLWHYETAQPRKAELLFSGMLSGPSQCRARGWAPERFARLRNTFASQRH